MLRAALPLSRRAVLAPANQRAIVRIPCQPAFSRGFAEIRKPEDGNTKPSISDPRPVVLPGSPGADVPKPPGPVEPGTPLPPVGTSNQPGEPRNVPLVPPTPENASSATQASTLKPKKKRRFRNFLLNLIVLSALGYAGGVAYSLRSDNFHDFFTEYIPFGEDAVLYFEEREFRKRFPRLLNPSRSIDTSPKINIPQKSGVQWQLSKEQDESESKGRHMSALDAVVPSASPKASAPETSKAAEVKSTPKADTQPPAEKKVSPEPSSKPTPAPASAKPTKEGKSPDVNEPSVYVPVSRIDPLAIPNANEPLVQDLVKVLNDIITVINMDNSTGKYTSTFEKAKAELAGVGKKILEIKSTEHESAKKQIQDNEADFDKAAQELVRRLEEEMRGQESKWRGELETERQRIAHAYEERLQAESEKSNQLNDEKLKSQLLEQAVALKKQFASTIKDQVESERDGRLARLSELSSSVEELEKLTAEWNGVIDSNLKTQHLQVVVEAVRSNLEQADRPRPFIKELAALKEVASDDAVINSAIASISPVSYQRGIPTSAQLIDRFRRVADEVRKASLLPEDAGLASHAASVVLSKVMFKKQGRAVGNDVESILTRTETLLEEGNLDDAAREMNTLKGWAKALSSDWLNEVRRVLEVRQAIDVITTEARLQSLKVD